MKYWIILIVALIILIGIRARVKKRGYFWKDKAGKELSSKQFFKRWGEGIEGITPLQQSKMSLMGIWIVVSGLIAGIIINFLVKIENISWWLELILIGSLIVTGVQMLGTYQKYRVHKKVEQTMKELSNSPEELKNENNQKAVKKTGKKRREEERQRMESKDKRNRKV